MAAYIATFITGFQETVRREIVKDLPGAEVIRVYDGLIHFRCGGDFRQIIEIPYLNNLFFVIQSFTGSASFARMAEKAIRNRTSLPISRGTFRVRFSEANQFAGVPKSITRRVEEYIRNNSDLVPDRVDPQVEIWFLKRSEGDGFFCELLHKRQATEKTLQKGELRPELVCLMLRLLGEIRPDAAAADPFAGSGAIPKQLLGRVKELYVSDIDPELAQELSRRFSVWPSLGTNVHVSGENALELPGVPNEGLDLIATDPPWGYYEEIGDIPAFYRQMFASFRQKLKKDGRVLLLSARKAELEEAAGSSGFRILQRVDTLVNGKKAGVYILESLDSRP